MPKLPDSVILALVRGNEWEIDLLESQSHEFVAAEAKRRLIAACSVKLDPDIHPDAPAAMARRYAIADAVRLYWWAKRQMEEKNA
jgi:hypothetical protein